MKTARRIGIDLSILDRSETGISVYTTNLYSSLKELNRDDYDFLPLRAPRPLPRRNIFTKLCNFVLEQVWLFVLLPIKARWLHLDLLHMPANIISPLVRIPQICSIHDAHFITNPEGRGRLFMSYARLSIRFAARHADMILCDSNSAKKEIVDLLGAKAEKIEVVYLGLTHRQSEPADTEAVVDFQPYILSVSATEPTKNFPALVEAFHRLVQANRANGYHLVIAGPRGHSHGLLEKMIKERGLTKIIKLTGRVSDSRLAALYENASIFVYPSFCEGFGFPPLEAMHYGVPVVASNATCIPETLGEAALYFDPRDIDKLAALVNSVMSDQNLQKSLTEAGRKRSAEFTWEKTAAKTLAVYESLLDASPIT